MRWVEGPELGHGTGGAPGPRGEGEADSMTAHVLVLHPLAGARGRLEAAKAEHRRALGHAHHLASAVVGEAAEPELHAVPQALIGVGGEVVHIEEVETGLKEEGRKRQRACLV